MPKIIIWTGRYTPDYESISKEIQLLFNSIDSIFIHSLSPNFKFCFKERMISYPSKLYPLRAIVPILEKRFDISHIYVGHRGYFYTSILRKKPIILTHCERLKSEDRDYFISRFKKMDHIIVESSKDVQILNSLGFTKEIVSLIYPSVDLSQFKPSNIPDEPFKILFASAPISSANSVFYARGVHLILNSLKNLDNAQFVLLWRNKCLDLLYSYMNRLKVNKSNLIIVNRMVERVNLLLSNVHAVIAPFTTIFGNKACPHSLIEGLASGKPVLASNMVGISDLIEKEKCGVAFEPTVEGLVHAVEELRRNYQLYQSNSRYVAEKYFSKEIFIRKYQIIYEYLSNEYMA